ncbi:MDR family NADP-dependent oxidoreductase [Sphingomonas sp. YL-JM2C]
MSAAFVPAYSEPAVNRRVLLVRRPTAIPQPDDFALDEMALVPLAEGQVRVRAIYLSVDPAQRGWAADAANYSVPVPLGEPMRALGVGVVVESRTTALPPGRYVYGWLGWQDYATVTPEQIITTIETPRLPLSAYAGILGINGLTAYLALHKIGRPTAGDTILVSTAAGAVGSTVGQLARAAGLQVIGLTSSAMKAERLTARFGYHVGLNYRDPDWIERLGAAAPEGLDIYFDNVGGAILDATLRRMRIGGRIVQCGTASVASWEPAPVGPRPEREVLTRRLHWGGFVVFDHAPDFSATIDRLADAAIAGTLVYREDISHGIEAAPASIAALYAGENEGKKLIFIG